MNDSTLQVRSASKEMATDSRTIMNEVSMLKSGSENMQQGVTEMSSSAEKINELGNMLTEISQLMEKSITSMGKQVDQFKV